MTREKRWPSYGIIQLNNPYYKLESRNPYIDVPNYFIGYFLSDIQELTERYEWDQERLYKKIIALKDRYNNEFEKEYGDWLRLIIKKSPSSKKPFGIQWRLKWDKFHSFLENYSQDNEISLEYKYQYIALCRLFLIPIVNRGSIESILDEDRLGRLQNNVREICKNEIDEIHLNVKNLLTGLQQIKLGLFSISKRKILKDNFLELGTLMYFPEMTTTLQGIDFLAQNGLLTSCYREMRKILENLYWVIFDDLLILKLLNNFGNTGIPTGDIPAPSYRGANKKWQEWARSNKATLIHLGELKEKIQFLSKDIYLYGRIKEYNWGKKKITNALLDNLSYSSFLLLTGLEKPKDEIDFMVPYEVKNLKGFAKEDLKSTLKQVKGNKLSKSDERFIEELIKRESDQLSKFIVPSYPSNDFVIQFVNKILHVGNINDRYYGRYSYFVHSYGTSWQIIPFSSVLEFKIFKHEVSEFANMILKTFEKFFEKVNYKGQYSRNINF